MPSRAPATGCSPPRARVPTLEALNAAGFTAVKLDVNDAEDIARASERVKAEAGRLDVLVNNAGYGAMGPLLDGGAAGMRQQFETNVFSLVELTRACFPLLRASRGLVINIGSISSVLITPFAGAYCASKAAVHALSGALRMELAPFGIQVMEVQPGAIESSFGANASHSAEQLVSEQSPWWPVREGIRARANASQENPTPASQFAATLLAAVAPRRAPGPAAHRQRLPPPAAAPAAAAAAADGAHAEQALRPRHPSVSGRP